MTSPIIDWSKLRLPDRNEKRLGLYQQMGDAFSEIADRRLKTRAMAAAQAQQEKDNAFRQQQLAQQADLARGDHDMRRAAMEQAAGVQRGTVLRDVAQNIGAYGPQNASAMLQSAGYKTSPVEREVNPQALPSAQPTSLQAPSLQMPPVGAQQPAGAQAPPGRVMDQPLTSQPRMGAPGLLASPLAKPDQSLSPATLSPPPPTMKQEAIRIAYGNQEPITVAIPQPDEEKEKQAVQALQVAYATTLGSMGDKYPQEVRDEVVAMVPAVVKYTGGNTKEARAWLDKNIDLLVTRYKQKAGSAQKLSGTGVLSGIDPKQRDVVLDRADKVVANTFKTTDVKRLSESEGELGNLLAALDSPDPGAQKTAVWKIAKLWNGSRITDKDMNRVEGFSNAWDSISTTMSQWAKLDSDRQMGTLSPGLIQQLKSSANVVKQTIEQRRAGLQDAAYSAIKRDAGVTSVLDGDRLDQFARGQSEIFTDRPQINPDRDIAPPAVEEVPSDPEAYNALINKFGVK